MNLPIIESCTGCGACCLEQESPPGYAYILQTGESFTCDEDLKRFRSLPESAIAELKAYVKYLEEHGEHPNRGICIWLDEKSRQCRYYEHRPEICREVVERNDESCLGWRAQFGI